MIGHLKNILKQLKISGLHKTYLPLIVIVAIIFTLTCQEFSPDYAPGLDSSYQWGLNYLFVHDYGTLQQLIYPIGPLAFLKMPTTEGANFAMALIFYLIVKCGFLVLGFKAAGAIDNEGNSNNQFTRWLIPSVFLLAFSYFANIDVILIFTCILLCLESIKQQKLWLYATACLLATLALFIKISIGVNALSAIALTIPLYFFEHRNIKKMLWMCGISAGIFISLSFLIIHHPQTLLRYYIGATHLVFGYGSLSATYENHLVYLILFAITLLAAPFLCKGKYSRYAYLLSLIPLFAFYKHGFIREDCPHYFGMVYFMVCFWMILILIEEKRKTYLILLSLISVTSLLLNAKEMSEYQQRIQRPFSSVANMTEPYFHYHRFVRECDAKTKQCLPEKQLSDTMRQVIGHTSIDIYPFEFSYAAQNKLNWQPRTSLGSALTPYLESLSAENFDGSDDAAQYILWHFQNDEYGKTSISIDQRYFLNDEPIVVTNILNHYEVAAREDHLLLLKHTSVPALGSTTLSDPFVARWDEWITVPQHGNDITRIRVNSKKNFLGKIAGTFYKDITYSIEYQTDDGKCYLYRYDPAFATEGLWCNPFVQIPYSTEPETRVVKVRFHTENAQLVKPQLTLQFERIRLSGKRDLFLNK